MSISPEDFQAEWNRVAAASGWVPCRKMTAARQQQLRLRMRDEWWADNWREALAKAAPIPGLRGRNERNWKAGVDWFLRPGTVVKIVEGFYDQWKPAVSAPVAFQPGEAEKKLAEMREYERKAFAEWQARGEVPKLARE